MHAQGATPACHILYARIHFCHGGCLAGKKVDTRQVSCILNDMHVCSINSQGYHKHSLDMSDMLKLRADAGQSRMALKQQG